jgi:hypothetical protein
MFTFCKSSEHFGSKAVVDANWNHTAASKQKHKESAISTLKSRLRNNPREIFRGLVGFLAMGQVFLTPILKAVGGSTVLRVLLANNNAISCYYRPWAAVLLWSFGTRNLKDWKGKCPSTSGTLWSWVILKDYVDGQSWTSAALAPLAVPVTMCRPAVGLSHVILQIN